MDRPFQKADLQIDLEAKNPSTAYGRDGHSKWTFSSAIGSMTSNSMRFSKGASWPPRPARLLP